MERIVCKNCGNHFTGRFCNNCGEKVYTDHDKSMRHFLHETLHFFSHLDNKFFKTFALIFRRPGMLSTTYCAGVRNKYYNPFSLFFIGIVLYLLFPFFTGLNMSFNYNMINLHAQHMDFIGRLAEKKAIANNLSITELAEKYDHKSPSIAKGMLLIILPLTALVLRFLFSRKKKYFFEHLVLATEASCIMLYLNFFILPLILFIPQYIFKLAGIKGINLLTDAITIPAFFIYAVIWNTVAFKRFFEISYFVAARKGFLFLFLQSVVIFIIYRLILFLTVLLFI